MDHDEFINRYNHLYEKLYDETQDDISGVRAQIYELLMTAKTEASICNPEIVGLWEAQENLMKACKQSAAYIGSVVNKILGEEKENRCELVNIPVSDNSIQGIIYSINLGQEPISGFTLNQIITGIGKPCAQHYGLEIENTPDGKPQLLLTFSGTCSEHLQAHYIHQRLTNKGTKPYVMDEEKRSKLKASLYTLPENTEVIEINAPVMSFGVPCIEAIIDGQHRADMLSAQDMSRLEECQNEKQKRNFLNYLVCKYLLKDNNSWVSDGIPLCYVNRKDYYKIISTREFYALPYDLRKEYVLYNPTWDLIHDHKDFIDADGMINIAKWLESFENEYHISSVLSSKRYFGNDGRSIKEGYEKYCRDSDNKTKKTKKK